MKRVVQRDYHRNGQLREEVPFRDGVRHGIVREWHRNGVLATEEPYQDGLRHGLSRAWDEHGKLLGKFKMVHGTGIVRSWHDNGQLQHEISLVDGLFCGRTSMWHRDGTVMSDHIVLYNKHVTPAKYRQARAKDRRLPKLLCRVTRNPKETRKFHRHYYQVFVSGLLERPCAEALSWMSSARGARWFFGRFRRAQNLLQTEAGKFVRALYKAGAVEVVAADIYSDKSGHQYVDRVLVKLPKDRPTRAAIRKVCLQIKERKLGSMQPDKDIGETHLYLCLY